MDQLRFLEGNKLEILDMETTTKIDNDLSLSQAL